MKRYIYLKMADEANTAVIAFNCIDYNMKHSVVTVAEELNKPVIIMLYPEHCYRIMLSTGAFCKNGKIIK